MADLETAGTDALEKIKLLLPEFENAAREFDAADKQIDETRKELDANWEKVEDAANQFLEQVKKERADNQAETQETLQILIGLRGTMQEMEKDAKSKFEDAEEELENFTEKVKGTIPELQTAFEQVKATAKALQDRADAIEESLNRASQEASDFLTNEISNSFRELQQEVEQKASDVQTYILTDALPNIASEAESFAGKMKEFHDGLKDVAETASQKSESAFSDALENCLKEHFEVIEKIEATAEAAQKVLNSAMELINTGAEAIGEGKAIVDDGVDVTSTGLNLVVDTLTELKELFSSFSFVSM